ncbi:MAG: hypothetical protein K8I30_02775, partial [Anaerolineae bacterium]|nr:hypothetical protein [Anaerolineae bacterium]
MSNLEVVFEVPRHIEAGLSSGLFQRVGGVIVESTTKQVVAWLRDGGVDTVRDVVSSVPSPLAIIMTAARIGVSLIDGKLTRDSIQQVSEQVAGVSRQVQTVTAITAFTATGQVVNLALAGVSFVATMHRLDRLSEEVSKLGAAVHAEFARDRDLRFKKALQAARDVFETSSVDHRNRAIRDAVDGLYEARENFLMDFRQ